MRPSCLGAAAAHTSAPGRQVLPLLDRANSQHRSERRLRYGTTCEPSPSPSLTARRSARRTMVRATSSAALGATLAWHDELGRHRTGRLELVNTALESIDHLRGDERHAGSELAPVARRCRDLCHEDPEPPLEADQLVVELRARDSARARPESRLRLVDGTIRRRSAASLCAPVPRRRDPWCRRRLASSRCSPDRSVPVIALAYETVADLWALSRGQNRCGAEIRRLVVC